MSLSENFKRRTLDFACAMAGGLIGTAAAAYAGTEHLKAERERIRDDIRVDMELQAMRNRVTYTVDADNCVVTAQLPYKSDAKYAFIKYDFKYEEATFHFNSVSKSPRNIPFAALGPLDTAAAKEAGDAPSLPMNCKINVEFSY